MGRDMLDHQKWSAHVDRHDAIPGLIVPLDEIARLELCVKRGIVDQYVDLTEAIDRLADESLHLFFVAHIDLDACHRIRAMPCGDLSGEFAPVGNVGNHHACAFCGEGLRIMPANSLCTTRHNCGFTGKPWHDFLRRHDVMAGLVVRKSGLSDLRLTYRTRSNSGRPELRAPSTSLWLIMQDVDGRNKCGHDDALSGGIHGSRYGRPPGNPGANRKLGALARRPHVGPFPNGLAQGRANV